MGLLAIEEREAGAYIGAGVTGVMCAAKCRKHGLTGWPHLQKSLIMGQPRLSKFCMSFLIF